MQIEKNADKLVKTLRVRITDQPGYLGRLCSAIGTAEANVGEIRLVSVGRTHILRDISIYVDDEAHLQRVLVMVGELEGIKLFEVIDPEAAHRSGVSRL
ncbi:MAG: hypothetical protein HY347_08975 [candidate division NC10 bacterium]|nr:hypothetical protein [candidate division NC10 bacterium]